jgi:hypothetical protein
MTPRDIYTLEGLQLVQNAQGFDVNEIAHHFIDDICTKVFIAKKAGTFMGQHDHAYDHGHLVAHGEVRLFVDGKFAGDFGVGEMILIEKFKKHVLLSLEDNTVGACIHNTHGEDEPVTTRKSVFGDHLKEAA